MKATQKGGRPPNIPGAGIDMNPFVKWAGGKGQLVDRIKELMPKHYNRYYEPFIGGGALLLAVQPKDGCINDINQSLINTYRVIREDPDGLISAIDALSQIACTRKVYTAYREAYNLLAGEGTYTPLCSSFLISTASTGSTW